MKKLLAATLLGASLLAFNTGSASAATICPFANAVQNFGSNTVTQPFNSANYGQLNNFVQQMFANRKIVKTAPVQQSNCPFQQGSTPSFNYFF